MKKVFVLMVFMFFVLNLGINNNIYANTSEKKDYFHELERSFAKIEEYQSIYNFLTNLKFDFGNYTIKYIFFYNSQIDTSTSLAQGKKPKIDKFEISFDIENKKNEENLILNIKLDSNNNPNIVIEINNKKIPFNKLSSKNKEKIEKLYHGLIIKLLEEINKDIQETENKLDNFFSK